MPRLDVYPPPAPPRPAQVSRYESAFRKMARAANVDISLQVVAMLQLYQQFQQPFAACRLPAPTNLCVTRRRSRVALCRWAARTR